MQASDVLKRAASLICGPKAYSRHATGAACIVVTKQWSASGALERAARPLRSGSWMLGAADVLALDAAKTAVCRIVEHPHIDAWEHAERPDWQQVRETFRAAA